MDTVHSRLGLTFTALVEIAVSTITSLSVCALVGFKITMVPWYVRVSMFIKSLPSFILKQGAAADRNCLRWRGEYVQFGQCPPFGPPPLSSTSALLLILVCGYLGRCCGPNVGNPTRQAAYRRGAKPRGDI